MGVSPLSGKWLIKQGYDSVHLSELSLHTLGDDKIIELIEHHSYVWSLEDDFKKAKIDALPLEEIGRRALYIRDIGYRRVDLKNALAEMVNDPVREIKQDHVTNS